MVSRPRAKVSNIVLQYFTQYFHYSMLAHKHNIYMSGFKSQIIIINIRQVILLEHYLVHIDVNGVFT